MRLYAGGKEEWASILWVKLSILYKITATGSTLCNMALGSVTSRWLGKVSLRSFPMWEDRRPDPIERRKSSLHGFCYIVVIRATKRIQLMQRNVAARHVSRKCYSCYHRFCGLKFPSSLPKQPRCLNCKIQVFHGYIDFTKSQFWGVEVIYWTFSSEQELSKKLDMCKWIVMEDWKCLFSATGV